jgi:hypothetical protein
MHTRRTAGLGCDAAMAAAGASNKIVMMTWRRLPPCFPPVAQNEGPTNQARRYPLARYPHVEISGAAGNDQPNASKRLFAKLSSLKAETFLCSAWRSRGTGGYAYACVTFGALPGLAR